jgi:predicted Zn-dependent peptidase
MPSGDGRTPRDAPGGVGRSLELEDETEQMHIVVGGRSMRRDDPDREALDVVNHVLGGGLSSRLFDEIRERRGLAYSVFSNAAAYADSGMWSVYAGTLPDNAEIVRRLIATELDRLVTDGITADELAIAQGYLTGSYEMGSRTRVPRMSRLGGQLTVLGRFRPVEEQLARWDAVTLDDTERVIGRRVRGGADHGDARPTGSPLSNAASTFEHVIRVGVNGAGGPDGCRNLRRRLRRP